MCAEERKQAQRQVRKRAKKSAKGRKRAHPRQNCKQPGLKQPGLGTPDNNPFAVLVAYCVFFAPEGWERLEGQRERLRHKRKFRRDGVLALPQKS